LPGESSKTISKNSFGYADGPDGLLGTWLISQNASAIIFSKQRTLTIKLPAATTTGNGMVATSTGNFGCEFQVSGVLAGMVLCVDVPKTLYSDTYALKISGDRGTGIGNWWTSATDLSSDHEAHALRIATRTGAKTGLNDGTLVSLVYAKARL